MRPCAPPPHERSRLTPVLVATLLLALAAGADAQTQKPDVNTVRSIRDAGPVVEIELHSSREFAVRDEVVVLRIGSKEFHRSRPPEGGSLNTLVFMLTPADFDALPDGEALTVKYGLQPVGSDEPGAAGAADDRGPRWNFGKLNKGMRR